MCILNMTDGNSQCVFVYMDCRYLNAALCLSERRTYPANGFLMGAVWCTDQSVLIPAVFVCLSFFFFHLGLLRDPALHRVHFTPNFDKCLGFAMSSRCLICLAVLGETAVSRLKNCPMSARLLIGQ